ncbi:MAG: preprotein translocase subunit SecY [Clostridiales bacterium]|nr:preprotein translocase subunit SecY [Clostridiales bacterium]
MWETLKNAWRLEDLRRRILYTLGMLLVFRIGSFIPIPGINNEYLNQLIEQGGLLAFFNIISGGSFGNFTIFAMSITPYINSSIIMQLLTVAIPSLEKLAKEGEEGRKKIAQYTRYLTVVLAFVQALGITYGLRGIVVNQGFFSYFVVALTLTAGTAFLMWLGEQITENGIGNGISLIIFAGIVARLPMTVITMTESIRVGAVSIWSVPLLVVGAIALVAAVVFVNEGERRIPVQYAKRVVGRRMYGGQSTHLPMKVNAGGVIPIIFAISILMLPQTISQFWPSSGIGQWFERYFAPNSALYLILYAILIILFTYFYAQITFNPIEISDNLRQYGGFIPGIRPGHPTAEYLARISSRITLAGALFLAAVAVLPAVFTSGSGIPLYFGGSAVLIVIGVALETMKQLEAQMLMRHYKGFLK